MDFEEFGLTIMGLFAAVLLLVGLLLFANEADKQDALNDKFAGACQLLKGKVSDDLCVKGDTVILRKSEFIR